MRFSFASHGKSNTVHVEAPDEEDARRLAMLEFWGPVPLAPYNGKDKNGDLWPKWDPAPNYTGKGLILTNTAE